ncbi:MAG: FHA domain-containing protein [Gemmatimonadota bacterium]|nr:FHA domain-containing protein [Gemmatimonadota bacterium]
MTDRLALFNGLVVIPLDGRPVAIGRLPECDVMLEGWEVSRRHARIVPTTAGPLLVDRSRFGTFVNQAQVVSPVLLAAGDVIRIGRYEVKVDLAPAGLTLRGELSTRGRVAGWLGRFGPSELMGAAAAVAGAWLAQGLGGGRITMVIAAVAAETICYYAALLLRDLRYEARERRNAGLGFGRRGAEDVVQNLIREFGVAEAVDSLVLRPLAFYLGLSLLPLPWGVLGGKVLADFVFYGPVLKRLHWRLGSRGAPVREVASLRSTQAVPVATLGELRLLDDAREPRSLTSGPESGGASRSSVSDG